jgi:hypothetical protein
MKALHLFVFLLFNFACNPALASMNVTKKNITIEVIANFKYLKIANICDTIDQIDWSSPANAPFVEGSLTINSKLGGEEMGEVVQHNTSSLSECAKQCCQKINCNFAYLKQSNMCYLITCLSDELCSAVPNKAKLRDDPADYMIKIRSVGQDQFIFKTQK